MVETGDRPESALVIAFPELDPIVDELRLDLDPSSRCGTPPHITLLYPFIEPAHIDEAISERVRRAIAGVHAFEVTFAELGWFGEEVLWLAPTPIQPIFELITRLSEAFPAQLPYGGEFPDPVPHLTLGVHENRSRLAAAAKLAGTRLPIRARAFSVTLMVGSSSGAGWRALHSFHLVTKAAPRRQ